MGCHNSNPTTKRLSHTALAEVRVAVTVSICIIMAVSKPCLRLFTCHRISFVYAQTRLRAREMRAVRLWHCSEAGKPGWGFYHDGVSRWWEVMFALLPIQKFHVVWFTSTLTAHACTAYSDSCISLMLDRVGQLSLPLVFMPKRYSGFRLKYFFLLDIRWRCVDFN